MKPNPPVNRLSSPQPLAAGVAAQPGVNAEGKQAKAARSPRVETSSISGKVELHGRWASMSRFQAQLSRVQGAEQAVVNTYKELHSLTRQLNQSGARSEALAARVASLRQSLEQGKVLDNNLKLQQNPARASYVLERVDLLSPRPQAEQINLQLPSGGNLTLSLDAGAGVDQNLRQLQKAFDPHQLKLSLTGKRQLRVEGGEKQLSSPWLFRGQGVRVPAGNPVTIQLAKETSELARLEDELRSGEHQQQKLRVQQLLATLEQERRVLDSRRQQLVREIQHLNIKAAQKIAPSGDASGQLRDQFRDGDFTVQLGALLAQANASRPFVVALLGR